ncbi:TPA: GspH/FimT family protein [Stenotrophomonas maltophilia]
MPRHLHAPTARPARGIQLIELLLILMLLAVALALAWGPWQRALRHLQAESLRRELVASLSLARSTAVTERRRVSVCGSSDGQQCDQAWSRGWRVRVEARTAGGGPGRLLRAHTTSQRRVELHTSDHRSEVQFRPDGRNAGTNQSIVLCVDGYEHSRVIINVPGRVRSERPRQPAAC